MPTGSKQVGNKLEKKVKTRIWRLSSQCSRTCYLGTTNNQSMKTKTYLCWWDKIVYVLSKVQLDVVSLWHHFGTILMTQCPMVWDQWVLRAVNLVGLSSSFFFVFNYCILFILPWSRWVNWTKKVDAAQISTKTENCSKGLTKNSIKIKSKNCDVTWTESCKQTSADSSVSHIMYAANIYLQVNI